MFSRRVLTSSLAVAVTCLAALLSVSPAADAAFPGRLFFVRPGNFVPPSGTTGAATMHVRSDGVHIHTSAPSDLAAATFEVPGGLPMFDFNIYGHEVTYGWSGSVDQPGIHYDIDLDQDGQADLELVGEHVYGNDLWLNRGFFVAHRTIPLAVLRDAAPCNRKEPQRPLLEGCGSAHGARYHGTIYDWRTGFEAVGHPDGSVLRGGFSATGGQIDGVLDSVSIGIYSFRFTTDPRVPATLTIAVHPRHTPPGGTVTIVGTVEN